MRKNMKVERICVVCDDVFLGRKDAATCSNRCRMRLSRRNPEELVQAGPTWLYKAYNQSGNLLYVGITSQPTRRMTIHKCKSIWWEDKEKVTWQIFSSRKSAMQAETFIISSECPVFNVTRY